MKKLILMLVFAACAAQQAQAQAQQTQKLFSLKYADANEIRNLLSPFPATISPNRDMRVIAVTATKETLASIEEALKILDVAPVLHKNIEVTGYILLASMKVESAPESPDLAGVVKQMRALFPYKSYHLAETIVVRGRDGVRCDTGGFLAEETGGRRYNFTYVATAKEAKLIRFDNLQLTLQLNQPVHLFTNVDVQDGQKVVVGKSNMTGGDSALILVLSAKVVD